MSSTGEVGDPDYCHATLPDAGVDAFYYCLHSQGKHWSAGEAPGAPYCSKCSDHDDEYDVDSLTGFSKHEFVPPPAEVQIRRQRDTQWELAPGQGLEPRPTG